MILDGYFQEDPLPAPPKNFPRQIAPMFSILDAGAIRSKLHRWRFNLRDGSTREEHLDAHRSNLEFGMFNQRYAGRKYRYTYSTTLMPGMFLMNGWVKHDLQTGEGWRLKLAPGRYCSESPFAPRLGAVDEDDGYLVSFIIDENKGTSECLILDAKRIGAGPVARVKLPNKISSGTHSCWAGRERL